MHIKNAIVEKIKAKNYIFFNYKEWIEEGKTIVFATHDVDLTYEWADNVVVLYDEDIVVGGGTIE